MMVSSRRMFVFGAPGFSKKTRRLSTQRNEPHSKYCSTLLSKVICGNVIQSALINLKLWLFLSRIYAC